MFNKKKYSLSALVNSENFIFDIVFHFYSLESQNHCFFSTWYADSDSRTDETHYVA